MAKAITFKDNKKAYLLQLKRAVEKAELTYFDISQDLDGYPFMSVKKSFGSRVSLRRFTIASSAQDFSLSFDEIEMIAAYAEGLKRKKT